MMIFGIWLAIGIAAGSWLLSKLLNKPEESIDQKRPEVDMPLAEEGLPMPLCYGRVRLRTPQVMWWEGEMKEHPSSWTSEKDLYYLRGSLQLNLGLLVDHNDINRIWFGDKLAWTGFAAAGTPQGNESRLLLDWSSGLPSGPDSAIGSWEGDLGFPEPVYGTRSFTLMPIGLYGKVHWFPGTFTQGLSTHVDAAIAGSVPNFRGMQYLLFEDCLLSPETAPPPIHVEVVGYPDALALTGDGHKISNQANPVEIIYDLLTNTWGRLGIDTALIDTASFQTAGNTIATEGNGVSVLVDRGASALSVIRELLEHIDGMMWFDPFDGKLHMGLVREDYTIAALPIYTDDHMDISKAEWEQSTWQDAVDQVRMSYEARASYNKTTQAIAQNMATFYGRSPNRIRSTDINYRYIKSWGPIQQITSRNLVVASTPVKRVRIPFNREVFDLRPNSLFRWSSTLHGFSNWVIRVADIDFGSESEGIIWVDGFEDRFALDNTVYGEPVEVTPVALVQPAESTIKQTIEMPQWMGYRAEVEGLLSDRDMVRMFYLARPAGTVETAFAPQVSEDAGSTYARDGKGTRPFAQYALVHTAYDRTNEPYDTTTGLLIKDPTDPAGSLQTRSVANIRLGSNLILAVTAGGDQEIISYESFQTLFTDAAAEVWQVDESGGPSYVNETTDYNSAATGDFQPFPASEAVDDWCAFGFATRFGGMKMVLTGGTQGVGGAGVWEYWNGSKWFALSGVSDGTTGFTSASGNQFLNFTAPADWVKRQINGGASLYFIRFRITTVYTTNPVYSQGFIQGQWKLENVWRGLLDTSPIDLAAGTELWFLDDGAIWLECLGGKGFDGDEAMKIKLMTFAGLIGGLWSGYTAEDLQLANRSICPYPPDKITMAQIPALEVLDTGLVNEYPGTTVEGFSDPWITQPELVWFGSRRYRKQESIRRGDDADEDPDESALPGSFGTPGYDLDVDADGGGYVTLGNDTDDQTPHSLDLVGFGDGGADELARVRTKRTDDGLSYYSLFPPTVLAHIAEWRQQVVNPGFEDATAGRGWTATSGTPVYATGSGALGLGGTYFHAGAAAGTVTIEQVRKLQAASGKYLFFAWRRRDFSGGTVSTRFQIVTEKDDGTDLDTFDSGFINGANGHWDRSSGNFSAMNALTTQMRITLSVINNTGSGQDGAIDGVEVYQCKTVYDNHLANSSMDNNIASWTASNMAHSTANKSYGAGGAAGGASVGTCQLYQDSGTLPGTVAQGDIAVLRMPCRTGTSGHTVKVTLESRDSGSTVLRTATTGVITLDGDTEYHMLEVHMLIPNNHDHFRAQFDGDGGAAAPDVQVGEGYLFLYERS